MAARAKSDGRKGKAPPGTSAFKRPPSSPGEPPSLTDFPGLFKASAESRIKMIRNRVPAAHVKVLARRMNLAQDKLSRYMHIPLATLTRKAARNEGLSLEDSERFIGLATLIGQVQTMVEESGTPDGFDAAVWTARWLEEPLPALDGQTPASYLDTAEGQRLVANLLSMMASGAYA
jgi:putative toxin-antitoxin system antitoxin component (TIGR02293 family)